MGNISILTAQNVNIEYQPAGITRRLFAAAIDYTILASILIVISQTIVSTKSYDAEWKYLFLLGFIIVLFYSLLMELFFNGRSVGKMALQLRVVRLDGKKLAFWDCLLRWVLRLIDITISLGGAAIISIILTRNMQRIGDLAAGTTVVVNKKTADLSQLDLYSTTDNYQPVFPQVILLGDKDITIIKRVYQKALSQQEFRLLDPLCVRIKEITGIQTNLVNTEFIHTILRDYHHLTKM